MEAFFISRRSGLRRRSCITLTYKTMEIQQHAAKIGLNNIKKTEIMTLNLKQSKQSPDIKIDGKQLESTSSFTYLGSVVTMEGGSDRDIKTR